VVERKTVKLKNNAVIIIDALKKKYEKGVYETKIDNEPKLLRRDKTVMTKTIILRLSTL